MAETYFHEDVSPCIKIDCGQDDSVLPFPVRLLPTSANDRPFGVKVSTCLASILLVAGCKEDCN